MEEQSQLIQTFSDFQNYFDLHFTDLNFSDLIRRTNFVQLMEDMLTWVETNHNTNVFQACWNAYKKIKTNKLEEVYLLLCDLKYVVFIKV